MKHRKWILLVLVAVAAIVAIHFLPIGEWLQHFQHYVRGIGPLGYVVFALVYAVACLIPSPAPTLLTGLAGATFGIVAGSIVVVIGAVIGATLAFILARTALRSRVEKFTTGNERFKALDRAIEKEGGKIVFLTRLSPIFPFTYLNYAFGLTAVRLIPYVVATLAGIIPGTVAFVYIGFAAAGAATGSASHLKLGLQIVGAIATLLVTIFVARLAKREIAKAGVE